MSVEKMFNLSPSLYYAHYYLPLQRYLDVTGSVISVVGIIPLAYWSNGTLATIAISALLKSAVVSMSMDSSIT